MSVSVIINPVFKVESWRCGNKLRMLVWWFLPNIIKSFFAGNGIELGSLWITIEYCWCELHLSAMFTTVALFCEIWAWKNIWASTHQRVEREALHLLFEWSGFKLLCLLWLQQYDVPTTYHCWNRVILKIINSG